MHRVQSITLMRKVFRRKPQGHPPKILLADAMTISFGKLL
jgi:hypothetical protein